MSNLEFFTAGLLLCTTIFGCTENVFNPITNPPVTSKLEIRKLEFVQTHVIPAEGKEFQLAGFGVNEQRSLRVVANRDALVLFEPTVNNLVQPKLEVLNNDALLTSINLNPPESLPKTEANGIAYSSSMYWANLSGIYIKGNYSTHPDQV